MLFTQHPKQSEFFDVDTFLEENTSPLRDMWERAIENLPRRCEQDEEEWDVEVSLMMCHTIYAERDEPTVEMFDATDPADSEDIVDLATPMTVLVRLFHLERIGAVTHVSGGWKIHKDHPIIASIHG